MCLAALAVALGTVFLADRNGSPAPRAAVVVNPESAFQPGPVAPPLRLAVTRLSTTIWEGFSPNSGPGSTTLNSRSRIGRHIEVGQVRCVIFDLRYLFAHWMKRTVLVLVIGPESGSEKGMRMSSIASAKLSYFVGRGGTIYASDWRLILIHDCFPELFDGEDFVTGAAQDRARPRCR